VGIQRVFSRSFIHLALLFVTGLWFLPTLGLFITSFRDPSAIADTGWWTVFARFWEFGQFTLQNYINVWEGENMARHFWNSIQISVPSTVLPILIASLAAYALARMRFYGRRVLIIFTAAMLIVPLHLTFVPVIRMYLGFSHLTGIPMMGELHGLILAHTGYAMPLAIYLLYNFMLELPNELFESSVIDGANSWQAFWRIVFPLSLPGMVSVAVFQFLWVWNSILVTAMFVQFGSRNAPLQILVTDIGQMGREWQKLTAAAFILIIVPMLLFFLLQRYFVRGLLGGSVKG